MTLTQEEAKKWAKILQGFAEGKSYQIPYLFDNNGVAEYGEITDFTVNPQCPTIRMTYGRYGDTLIDADFVKEKI